MKSFALLSACTALSLLAGCDSGSSPTQVETKTVYDTVYKYRNDRFALGAKVINGRWILRTTNDSADMWIFQDSNKVEALVKWTKASTWNVEGIQTSSGWTLNSDAYQEVLILKVAEEKDMKVNKLKVSIIANSEQVPGEFTAERRL